MTKNKLAALVAGFGLATLAVGCADTTNRNVATTPSNANSNTAVVVNNNGNANTSGVTSTNGNANTVAERRAYNANITREEYDRDRDRYGRDARDAGDTVGTGVSDGWIHIKTKSALMTTDDIRDSTMNVDVDNGVVTLRGSVANAAQKTRAADVARKIDGVKNVRNQLVVKAEGDKDDDDDALNGNRNGNANGNRNANTNANTRRG